MINLNHVSLYRDSTCLFEEISLTLHDKQRVGLIGANGCGKSSLLAMIMRTLEPSSGSIDFSSDVAIRHVAQEIDQLTLSAHAYVLQGLPTIFNLQQAIEHAEKQQDFTRLAELHSQFSLNDGYAKLAFASELLAGLGFDARAAQKPVQAFSGGWRMRLNLAKALIAPSDVLLLDEPTNHLDLEAILWLEKWLQTYPGLLIMVSHDRDFLDKIISHVLHVEHTKMKLYKGNYSSFEKVYAEQLAQQHALFAKQQQQIKHMQAYVERFRYKASKAKQAQSRLKAITRIDQVAAVQVNSPFQFYFKPASKLPYPLLKIERVTFRFAEHTVFENLNWQLVPGDRVALIGPNGAGKSTLLKLLLGKHQPNSGQLFLDKDVQIGYFAQHQLETLSADQDALTHMLKLDPHASVQQHRDYLGQYGFSGDAVLKAVGSFSGGEKARLALAMMIYCKPNLLLLDEPTNHLDMEMRMALTLALQQFDGALVLISHDRYLIRNTVDRLYLLAEHRLQAFDGDLDTYRQWLAEFSSTDTTAAKPAKVDSVVTAKPKSTRPNPVKLRALERKIMALEQQLTDINAQLNDPALYEESQKTERERLYQTQHELQSALQAAEDEWLRYHD